MPPYPSGPPAFWASNARNQAVNQAAGTQNSLNGDPAYVQAYLKSGTPPSADEIQSMRGVDPMALQSAYYATQQAQQQAQAAQKQRQIAQQLAGLQGGYSPSQF